MIKKIGVILAFLIILIIPLISAQFYFPDINLAEGANQLIDQTTKFGTPFFEKIIGEYSTSEFFFSKILLLILLIIIIKNVLEKTPIGEDNKKVSSIVSIIISVLAIRFINENQFFEAIFIQYGVLGIAITTIIPMVIFFYFIHNTKVGTFGRKVFWFLYAITLTAIWLSKSNEIPEVANWIYALMILATLIFLFMDKSIHAYLGLSEIKKFVTGSHKKLIRDAKKELDDLEDHFKMGRITPREYVKEKKVLRDYIFELSKE